MTTPSFDDDTYAPPEEDFGPMEPAPPEEEPRRFGRGTGRRGKHTNDGDYAAYGNFRQPPADREAEQGVLGAMLLSPATASEVSEIVTEDDFYYPAHAIIFKHIMALFADGKEIDAVVLSGRLDRYGELERAGGARELGGAGAGDDHVLQGRRAARHGAELLESEGAGASAEAALEELAGDVAGAAGLGVAGGEHCAAGGALGLAGPGLGQGEAVGGPVDRGPRGHLHGEGGGVAGHGSSMSPPARRA